MTNPIDTVLQWISSLFSTLHQLILSFKLFPSRTFVDPGVLLVVIAVSLLGISLLLRVVSRAHRQKYRKLFRSSFLVGGLLGLVIPWNDELGLLIAMVLSFLLLGLAVSYVLPRSSTALFHHLSKAREHARDGFLYFSVITGVSGIFSTVISILSPSFFGFSLSSLVPLSFDALSVLSALMEFTIPIPDYIFVNGVIMSYASKKNGGRPGGELLLRSSELDTIVRGSRFMVPDLIDALRILSRQGFATARAGGKGQELSFQINIEGVRYLEACHDLVKTRSLCEKNEIDKLLSSAEVGDHSDPKNLEKTRLNLLQIKTRLRDALRENYPILEKEWFDYLENRVNWDLQQLGK